MLHSIKGNEMEVQEGNPLRDKVRRKSAALKVENLIDARKINVDELNDFIKCIDQTENFDDRLAVIESKKQNFLFSSNDLIAMLTEITSVNTKLALVSAIGPRLTDPKSKTSEIVGMFRFADEKAKVEEVLKVRATAMAGSAFMSSDATAPRAGVNSLTRGGAGRGTGIRRPSGANTTSNTSSSTSSNPSSGGGSSASADVFAALADEDEPNPTTVPVPSKAPIQHSAPPVPSTGPPPVGITGSVSMAGLSLGVPSVPSLTSNSKSDPPTASSSGEHEDGNDQLIIPNDPLMSTDIPSQYTQVRSHAPKPKIKKMVVVLPNK